MDGAAGGGRAAALLGCTLALLLGASLTGPTDSARAAINPFGKPIGHDRAELRSRFLAAHPKGYAIVSHLGPAEAPTSLALGWHGTDELTADLNLGDPAGGGECGGAPEDPGSPGPWIEIRTGLPHPPLGKSFDLPLGLEHRVYRPDRDPAGALLDLEETGALPDRRPSLRPRRDRTALLRLRRAEARPPG